MEKGKDIDESVADKISTKRKRGRPKFGREEMISLMKEKNLFPDIRTERGFQNKCYEVDAVGAIRDLDGMEFLVDREKETLKSSILTEIGRLKDPETMRALAEEVCERAKTEKRTTKEWVQFCRAIRLAL